MIRRNVSTRYALGREDGEGGWGLIRCNITLEECLQYRGLRGDRILVNLPDEGLTEQYRWAKDTWVLIKKENEKTN